MSRPCTLFLSRLILALVSFTGGSGLLAESPEEIFERANDAYLNGDYRQAAEAYRSVLDYRISDPRVEYNLANTEFKLGRLGQAILHYERARRLDPTDAEILANLEYARSFTFDRVETEELIAPLRFFQRVQDRLGPDLQAWLVLILVWLAAMLLAWSFAAPGRFRAAHGWLLAALLVLVVLAATSWYGTYTRLEGQRLAIVLDDVVEVLAGPADNNATLFTIHEGLTLQVREGRTGEWIQVSLPNGLNGWLPLDAVGLVE